MKQYILILLLISINIFALDDMKMKARQDGNTVKVKARIISLMYGEVQAEKLGIKQTYITHLVARVGGEVVYDAAISSSWQRNPNITFQYKYLGRGDSIELTATNNNGIDRKLTTKIKKSPYTSQNSKTKNIESEIDVRLENPDIWKIQTTEDAIKLIYPTSIFIKEKINIATSSTGDYHPDTHIVNITTDVKLKSMAVFTNIGSRPALVAIFNISKSAVVDYMLKLKMRSYNGSIITVVGEGRDGEYYKDISHLSLFFSKDVFIEECKNKKDNLGSTSCKETVNEITLQKLTALHKYLIEKPHSARAKKILLEQGSWLKDRKKVCPSSNADCLSKYYQNRMNLLRVFYN